MHNRFVDKWCERYDTLWEEEGEAKAIAFLRKSLRPDDFNQVKKRFPIYMEERKQYA